MVMSYTPRSGESIAEIAQILIGNTVTKFDNKQSERILNWCQEHYQHDNPDKILNFRLNE